MIVRSQLSTVFHLDKCLGCHTCSVACKNVWTDRRGAEYMWWNNVETRPGTGYPLRWEDQSAFHGGWERHNGGLRLRSTGKARNGHEHLPPPSHADHGGLLRAVDVRLRQAVLRAGRR